MHFSHGFGGKRHSDRAMMTWPGRRVGGNLYQTHLSVELMLRTGRYDQGECGSGKPANRTVPEETSGHTLTTLREATHSAREGCSEGMTRQQRNWPGSPPTRSSRPCPSLMRREDWRRSRIN